MCVPPAKKVHQLEKSTPPPVVTVLTEEKELCQAESEYNAWEEDIAVVNIFFGKETIMGEMKL